MKQLNKILTPDQTLALCSRAKLTVALSHTNNYVLIRGLTLVLP